MSYRFPDVGTVCMENDICSFTVWAPLRRHVQLVLDHDGGLPIDMQRDERGYWTVQANGVKPGTRYGYKLDGEKKFPDPASRWQPAGVHGPSAVADTSFSWNDTAWKGIPLQDMIIYEIHTGTFTSEGTFNGIVSKLDYLKDLGVNTLELMPLAQFPGARNWGYDGVYPFAVQETYGGISGLKHLVDEAHKRGIAVLLDVVYNHLGPEGNYFTEYGPYFTDKYKTGWGRAMNFDDAWCDGVRHFFCQNALMWLDEFHIDGLRLDAVHAIWDSSASHFIGELKHKVTELEKRSKKTKVLIAEFDLNNPRYITPREHGGYGLDGQWVDEFHHALHSLVTREKEGYYEDFGTIGHLEKSFRDGYVYTGQYSLHRKKHFGVQPNDIPYSRFVVFAQNHDQVGNRMMGDRLSATLSFEQLKLVAATYLLSAFVPMLFMGEEYGARNPFCYFTSHTDAELIEMVRKGRREEFSYFKWEGEVPDPQAVETFQPCVLDWNNHNDEAVTLREYYRYLIRFRQSSIAMQGRNRDAVQVFPAIANHVLAFMRVHNGECMLVLLNFSDSPMSFTQPTNRSLTKIFDSAEKRWRGPGASPSAVVLPSAHIDMQPHCAMIFQC